MSRYWVIGHHDGGRHIQAWNQAGSRTRILEARFLYKRTECAHVSPEGVARESIPSKGNTMCTKLGGEGEHAMLIHCRWSGMAEHLM